MVDNNKQKMIAHMLIQGKILISVRVQRQRISVKLGIIIEGFPEQKRILKLKNNINSIVHYIIVSVRLCHVLYPLTLLLHGVLVFHKRNY